MERDGLRAAARGDRAGKRAGRRARGVALVDRGGWWHAAGTVRIQGRSVRIRRGLGLPASAATEDEALAALDDLVEALKAKVTGRAWRGDSLAVAASAYLHLPRQRPLGATTVRFVQDLVQALGLRRLNEITPADWSAWLEPRVAGRAAATRERQITSLLAFLAFARAHHGLASLPVFARDRKARNPNRRARRHVEDLRPDLVRTLFDAAHIAIRAQLAVEQCTGARVSSVLYGAALADLHLAPGREQIVFRGTKNGEDVTAALSPSCVAVLNDYLAWRGNLHDRQGPLFLTPRRQPYTDNGRVSGGQNKTGFNAAKRRAAAAIRARASEEAAALRSAGRRREAAERQKQGEADAALITRMTQHWFRHALATRLLRRDPRAALEQGGWLDIRSVMGYAHDVPEHRRALVAELDDLGTDLTQTLPAKPRKAR